MWCDLWSCSAGPGPVSIHGSSSGVLELDVTCWDQEWSIGQHPAGEMEERRGGGNNYFWLIRPWCMLLCPVITRSQGSRILNELLLWLHNDNWVYPPALFVPLWWSDDSAFLHWSPRYLLLLIWYFILAPVFVLWIWILTVILLPRASNAHLINRTKHQQTTKESAAINYHWKTIEGDGDARASRLVSCVELKDKESRIPINTKPGYKYTFQAVDLSYPMYQSVAQLLEFKFKNKVSNINAKLLNS